ncbi:uncharacterized protein LOC135170660 isoform X1 [Diachasmimorpha longicaudata]|uniref:uncharacterized protein LOC135170660 isoform X1 n=2 Tax=Diachasmimorpha longicaudata TaxID=58733 RepID=UPI0030B8E788
MLPESTFPVTGGIMQTEEVVPRAQPTGIDGSLTDTSTYPSPLHLPQHLACPLPSLVHMAVKQELQDDEERAREANSLRSSSNEALNSQQTETSAASTPPEVAHHVHHSHDTAMIQPLQSMESVTENNHDTTSRSRPSRGRRNSRWKLKFHHQALPPEYLDHYEAALAQEALTTSPPHAHEPSASSPAPTTSTSTSSPSPVTDVQGWLQRIAAMQQELCPRVTPPTHPESPLATNYRRSVITSASNTHSHHQQCQPPPRPPMKYSDLPYMGEITLDNSKPRRGRKPKKADICHLIYKNYGTILPGTPGHDDRKPPKEKPESHREPPPPVSFQRTDIQNRISSLLEKRLTQESRRNFLEDQREQDEPLNLCIKDLNQLKIRLLRKHGNIYESGAVKSETSSDGEDVECLGSPFPSAVDPTRSDPLNNNNHSVVNNNTKNLNNNDPANPGFVYWPNAGVFIHPMTLQSQFLYYQKMAQGDKAPGKPEVSPKEQKIVPKSIYAMLDNKSPSPGQNPAATPVSQPPVSPRPKRIAPLGQPPAQPTKRKRSAIFIPPMPTENNNNPATEVSICKFKFTGGAKPSLQEKKSLSVDSGGNFRYYSGTGDKSMRGYEFFPREALQQPPGQPGSSAGAFLSATGERIPAPACPRTATPDDGRRKRKTRKSLQREKLEQTFKEKGFLIQTQQLESAEGATYCKFRQLRKFTRYLFRSWKDYLPGNVGDMSQNPEPEGIDGEGDEHSTSPVSTIEGNSIDEHRPLPLT